MVKNREINGTEGIALVTPTPALFMFAWLFIPALISMTSQRHNIVGILEQLEEITLYEGT